MQRKTGGHPISDANRNPTKKTVCLELPINSLLPQSNKTFILCGEQKEFLIVESSTNKIALEGITSEQKDDKASGDMVCVGDFSNLKDEGDKYVLELDISALNKEKMDIEINQSSITISGEYSAQEETTSPGTFMQSKRVGSFSRTIPLPQDADIGKISSEEKGKMLYIYIPKK